MAAPRCACTCPVEAARSAPRPGRAWGQGLGEGCGGAAPPGGHHGVCTRLPPGPGPRPAWTQPDSPSTDPALVRAPGTGPPRAGLTWTYCGLGAWASDPYVATMGSSATAGRGSPAGFLLCHTTHPGGGLGPPHLDLLTRWPVCKNTLTRPLGKWCNEQVAQNKGNKTPNRTHEGFIAHLFQEQIRTR